MDHRLQLTKTPNPVTLEGQVIKRGEFAPGESLRMFLARHLEDLDAGRWRVLVDGTHVTEDRWDTVYVMDGQIIEAISVVKESALRLVAFAALMYFTMGAGGIAGGAFMGLTGFAGYAAATAAFMAGGVLINKVLPPTLPKSGAGEQTRTAYTLGDQRNVARQQAPMPLTFGVVDDAMDLLSSPYPWYEGESQYINMVLTPGFNVASVSNMRFGTNDMSNFDEVTVKYHNFSAMPEQPIDLLTDVDRVDGGTLEPGVWVTRTGSADSIGLQVDVEYMLFDTTSEGKPKNNTINLNIQYRPTGTSGWLTFTNTNLVNKTQDQQRRSFRKSGLAKGQYDVRAMMTTVSDQGKGSKVIFAWPNLLSIKEDLNSYDGLPQVGFTIRASGQFSGTVDQIVVQNTAKPMPIWTESGWATATTRENGLSNPGAQMLLYARGIYDEQGRFVGGMGLEDDEIDIEAIKGFTLNCARRNYRFDYQLKDESNHSDFLDKLTLAGMGQWTWAGGKLSVAWADEDQPITGVVNMANIDDTKFQVEYALINSADGIEYTFYNRATGKSETIPIPAPGVTTMLRPSRVSSDGVTEFDHALTMARYHLAQSLYQTKDVGFSTDIEALSFRRMSLITVSHDLTQWGYGGRLEGYDASRKALLIDDVIPARPADQSWVGVRVPGEDGYRVIKAVVNTVDNAREILLEGAWPEDSPLPNSSENYPADAYLWCWDIKPTLGATMRVSDLSFNTDFEQAEVSAVMETPEFWNFVKTGTYIPPKPITDLPTRPVVSNLRVVESQVPQDSTLVTMLDVIWDVSGYVSNTYVYCNIENEEQLVAGTTSERRMQIPIYTAGKYVIRVQPYGLDGALGIPQRIVYDTSLIGLPPPKLRTFGVQNLEGGFRLYSWGYSATEDIVPANFAGVEIRYCPSTQANKAWDQLTPLGGDKGFHTSSFQDILPDAGTWYFSARPRNTAGTLGEESTVTVTLTAAAGEIISGVESGLAEEIEDRLAADLAEINARIAAINAVAADLVNETNNRINAVNQLLTEIETNSEAIAQEVSDRVTAVAKETSDRVAALLASKLEWTAAVTAEQTARQNADESFAQQIAIISAGSGTQFDSLNIWHFNTAVEGWSGNGAPTVVDGKLRPANLASNPYVMSPDGLAADGNAYRFIKLRMFRVGAPTWKGKIYWITEADTTFNEAKSVAIPQPQFDANGVATVDIDNIPWNGASPVRRIMVALTNDQTATNYVMYDYIAIGRPAPGASVAMVQAETQARTTAIAAEATQRTSLATQMRGAYAGADLAQVTTGLLADEKTARSTADSAQVQRIGVMETRMPAGNGQLGTSARIEEVNTASITRDNANAESITKVQSDISGLIAQGPNLIVNGGFELGASVGWTFSGTNQNVSATEGRNGSICWKAVGSVDTQIASVNAGNIIPVTIGRTYRVTAWYKTSSDFNGTGANSKIRIARGDGSLIAGVPFGPNQTEWTQLTWEMITTTVNSIKITLTSDATVGTLWVDDVWLEEVTDVKANSTAVAGLTTRVTSAEGTITAQGNAITSLTSTVAGKADTSALNTLGGRVTVAEGKIDAQATSLTSVQAALGNIGGDNLIGNSSWDVDANGWSNSSTGQGSGTITQSLVDSVLPNSVKAWRWNMSNWPTAGYREAISNSAIRQLRVEGGKKHAMSVYVRGTAGPRVFLQVRWYDSAGATIRYSSTPAGAPFVVTEAWDRKTFVFDAPADAVSANVYVRIYGANTVDQWVEIDNIQLQVGEAATGYVPSVVEAKAGIFANAAATQALDTRVTAAEGTLVAQATAITNVASNLQNSGGDNLLPNSSFEVRTTDTASPTSWVVDGSIPGGITLSYIDSPLSGGGKAFRVSGVTTAANQYLGLALGNSPAIRPTAKGQTDYTLSGWVRAPAGLNFRTYIQFVNAAGATIATVTSPDTVATGEWQRYILTGRTSLTTAVGARVFVGRVFQPVAGVETWIEIDNVMLQEGPVASQWSPSGAEALAGVSANATAMNSLTTRVTSAEGTISSQGTAITNVTAGLASTNTNLDLATKSGSNMVVDGSFELRPVGFAIQSWAVTVAAGRTGANALQMSFASNVRSTTIQTFEVQPDRVYYCEAWAKRIGPAAGNIQLRFQVSNNGLSPSYPNFQSLNLSSISDTDWTKLSGYIRVGAGNNRALLQLNSANATTSATQLLWDDFVLMDVTEAYNAQLTANGAAQATTDLTARVVTAEGKIDSQATSLTNVQSSIGTLEEANSLIPNGKFTTGVMDWFDSATGSSFSWDATERALVSGAGSLRIRSAGELKLNPGEKVTISFRYKVTAGTTSTASDTVGLITSLASPTNWLVSSNSFSSGTGAGQWQTRRYEWTVPNTVAMGTVAYLRFAVGSITPSSGQIWIDDVVLTTGAAAATLASQGAANAQATSALTTRVTAAEGTITSQGNAITSLNNNIAGKADASALNSLTTRVSSVEGTVSSQATAITNVQASVNGKADAQVVQTMDVQVKNSGSGGNLIINSTFPLWQRNGWGWGSNANGWQELGNPTGSADFIAYGLQSAIGSRRSGVLPSSSSDYFITEYLIPVDPTKSYCVSAYFNTHRCQIRMWAELFNAAGQTVGYIVGDWVGPVGQGKARLDQYPRIFGIAQPTPDTAFARILVNVRGTNEGDPYFWMFQPMFSEVAHGATKPPPWSAGGAEASAQWGVIVQAGGVIGGIQLATNGATSGFNVNADVFSVTKPGGGERLQWANGRVEVIDGNGVARVQMGLGL